MLASVIALVLGRTGGVDTSDEARQEVGGNGPGAMPPLPTIKEGRVEGP